MSFLLDTDICSAHLRGDKKLHQRSIQYGGQLYISVVTITELNTWLCRTSTPRHVAERMPDFFAELSTIEVDLAIADKAGRIGAMLRDSGKQIGVPDLLIAATALVNDLTVATRNTRHFGLIPGLRCCDWLAE